MNLTKFNSIFVIFILLIGQAFAAMSAEEWGSLSEEDQKDQLMNDPNRLQPEQVSEGFDLLDDSQKAQLYNNNPEVFEHLTPEQQEELLLHNETNKESGSYDEDLWDYLNSDDMDTDQYEDFLNDLHNDPAAWDQLQGLMEDQWNLNQNRDLSSAFLNIETGGKTTFDPSLFNDPYSGLTYDETENGFTLENNQGFSQNFNPETTDVTNLRPIGVDDYSSDGGIVVDKTYTITYVNTGDAGDFSLTGTNSEITMTETDLTWEDFSTSSYGNLVSRADEIDLGPIDPSIEDAYAATVVNTEDVSFALAQQTPSVADAAVDEPAVAQTPSTHIHTEEDSVTIAATRGTPATVTAPGTPATPVIIDTTTTEQPAGSDTPEVVAVMNPSAVSASPAPVTGPGAQSSSGTTSGESTTGGTSSGTTGDTTSSGTTSSGSTTSTPSTGGTTTGGTTGTTWEDISTSSHTNIASTVSSDLGTITSTENTPNTITTELGYSGSGITDTWYVNPDGSYSATLPTGNIITGTYNTENQQITSTTTTNEPIDTWYEDVTIESLADTTTVNYEVISTTDPPQAPTSDTTTEPIIPTSIAETLPEEPTSISTHSSPAAETANNIGIETESSEAPAVLNIQTGDQPSVSVVNEATLEVLDSFYIYNEQGGECTTNYPTVTADGSITFTNTVVVWNDNGQTIDTNNNDLTTYDNVISGEGYLYFKETTNPDTGDTTYTVTYSQVEESSDGAPGILAENDKQFRVVGGDVPLIANYEYSYYLTPSNSEYGLTPIVTNQVAQVTSPLTGNVVAGAGIVDINGSEGDITQGWVHQGKGATLVYMINTTQQNNPITGAAVLSGNTGTAIANITLLSGDSEYMYAPQNYKVFASKYGSFEEKTICFDNCNTPTDPNTVNVYVREDENGLVSMGTMSGMIIDYNGNSRETFDPNYVQLSRIDEDDYESYFDVVTPNSINANQEEDLLYRINIEADCNLIACRGLFGINEDREQHGLMYYQNAVPASYANLNDKVDFVDNTMNSGGYLELNFFTYINNDKRKLVLNRYSYNNIVEFEVLQDKNIDIPVTTFVLVDGENNDSDIYYNLYDDLSINPELYNVSIFFRSPSETRQKYGNIIST